MTLAFQSFTNIKEKSQFPFISAFSIPLHFRSQVKISILVNQISRPRCYKQFNTASNSCVFIIRFAYWWTVSRIHFMALDEIDGMGNEESVKEYASHTLDATFLNLPPHILPFIFSCCILFSSHATHFRSYSRSQFSVYFFWLSEYCAAVVIIMKMLPSLHILEWARGKERKIFTTVDLIAIIRCSGMECII